MQEYASQVTIFDAQDPFLFAANLTQGRMVLAEDRVNEVALGITCSLFGIVLMMPFILLTIMSALEGRTKNHGYQSFDEIPFYACEVENN